MYLITVILYELLCRKWWDKTVQSYNFVVSFASAHHTMRPTDQPHRVVLLYIRPHKTKPMVQFDHLFYK